MISAPPSHYHIFRRIPLLFCCGLALVAGSGESSPAAELSSVAQAFKNEDPDLAEKGLRTLMNEEEEKAAAHRLHGTALLQQGLHAEAIAEFTAALQIDPQDKLAREYLFSIHYNRAQDLLEDPLEAERAREELEQAIAVRPDGTMSYYLLGTLNFREKKHGECIAMLLKIVDTTPESLRPNLHAMLYNSAVSLLNQNRALDAKGVIPYLSAAPQSGTNDLMLAAAISLANGDFANSAECYERVLHSDPLNAAALNNRGIALQRLEKIRQEEAAALLQQKSEIPPTENLSKPPTPTVISES